MAWDENDLTPDQEQRYRLAARSMYVPGTTICGYWHSVFRDECRKMNTEKELSTKDTKGHE